MKTERGVPMNYGWLEVPPGCTEQPWAARGQGHPGDSPGQGLQPTELTETGVLSPPPWVLGPQQRSWAALPSAEGRIKLHFLHSQLNSILTGPVY